MATQRFRGDAPAVAQVNTITPGTVSVGNQFTVQINGKQITFTATAGTAANVSAGLVAAIQASTIPEFGELTATDLTGTLTLTAKIPGVPFTQTSNASGGSATCTTSVTTASSGPNDWSVAANWSTGSVPVNSDDVYFDGTAVSCLYGLAQSGVTLNSLNITASFTGQLGLPAFNSSGYYEYRATYLAIGATTIVIGNGPGNGSGLIRINTGAIQTTLIVNNTASPSEQNAAAVQWIGTHASNVVDVNRGSVGVAKFPGETATVATLDLNYVSNQANDAQVYCGSGLTWTTINKAGGSLTLNSGGTTLTQSGQGDTVIYSGLVTNLVINAGTCEHNGAGTIVTNLTVGAATFSVQDIRAKTVTNQVTLYKGAAITDWMGAIAWSAGLKTVGCTLSDVTLNLGVGRAFTPA